MMFSIASEERRLLKIWAATEKKISEMGVDACFAEHLFPLGEKVSGFREHH